MSYDQIVGMIHAQVYPVNPLILYSVHCHYCQSAIIYCTPYTAQLSMTYALKRHLQTCPFGSFILRLQDNNG